MSAARLIGPGEGEVIGDALDRRVEILSDADQLHATWSRFGPGRDGAGLHIHRLHTDLFYVLEGELTVRLGGDDELTAVPAGRLARVPPLVVHGFRNASAAEVRYLNLHAPGEGFADYMRGLRDGRAVDFDQGPPPADGGRPPSEAAVGGAEPVADADGIRVALLADIEEIGIAELSAEPGAAPWPVEAGHGGLQSFYVLEGEIALALGEGEVRARAGSWAQLAPQLPYALSFPGPEPAHALIARTPSVGFGAFVRGR